MNTDSIAQNGVQESSVNRRRIALIDSDSGVRWALERGLLRSGYDVQVATTPTQLIRMVRAGNFDLVLLEILPEASLDYDLMTLVLDQDAPPQIVCTSVEAHPELVIECVRRGASDFLAKPFGLAEVRRVVSDTLAKAHSVGEEDASQAAYTIVASDSIASTLVGVSPAIRELRQLIRQLAATDLNCLIRGESGVGKDMIAREIHRYSARKDKPFIKVNCAALPENLLESELFGYAKGAFTGASSDRPGRFMLANEGVIFLDEIAEMHPRLQAKILQVIEHKEFTRLGGNGSTKVDVQIIAATNADLEERARSGAFRQDLYFRLNEFTIWITPLRERKEDIPLLIRYFRRKHGQYAKDVNMGLVEDELNALLQHDWPGNVRELENVVKRWLVLGRDALRPFALAKIPRASFAAVKEAPESSESGTNGHDDNTAITGTPEPTREEILESLVKHNWNRRKVADELQIGYQVLRRRIEKYGFERRG